LIAYSNNNFCTFFQRVARRRSVDFASPASVSDLEYAARKQRTRRDRFLAELEQIVPWVPLIEALEPH
jgi:hypothetical protein